MRLAYELGRTVRAMREGRGWSQNDLARAAGMTQSATKCGPDPHWNRHGQMRLLCSRRTLLPPTTLTDDAPPASGW
ncbi:helix-turn-helix transcriptional regulator [Streptosporangium sp. NPDC006930]|uniref:helix-turn-helix domain-containing protein n=1 Tax=Streptosporangium sp. NPDC006930 TaxID=3154783 RepID=UPI003421550E